jgi:SAM-dependent methyltransferase
MNDPTPDTVDRIDHRFYGDLAPWWPLISPPEEYVEEASFAADLLAADGATTSVLELGSGGGHVASHLAGRFELTLVDLSEPMLQVSRALNPTASHHQGDMRTVRLGQQFDAVLIHDAIDYMTTEDDLRAAFATAFAHCRPGGVALFMPDEIAETFAPGTDHGGTGDARYLEWSWDPDPTDTWTLTEYVFLLRDTDEVRSVHETHRHGLFARDTWLRLLRQTGFEASAVLEETTEDRAPRVMFRASR